MPKFEITGPDGKKYEVNAPDGSDINHAMSYVKDTYYSAQSQSPRDPYKEAAQKQSVVDNLLAGAGGGAYGLWLGAKQLLGKADPQEIEDYRKAMEGLRSTTAGTIGDIGGQVAAGAIPALLAGPAAAGYAGSVGIGAGLGALQPTLENESRGQNIALGAAGGAAGKYVGDKLVGLLRGRGGSVADQMALQSDETLKGLGEPSQELFKKGQELGFKFTPGQASGSKTLQKFEAAMESNPFTAGAFDDIKTHNAGVLNRVTAGAIGEKADYVNSTILEQAKDRIGSVYKMVADKTARQIPADEFVTRLKQINTDLEGLLPSNMSFIDNPLVKNFIDVAQKGQATGEQLQQIASKLGKAAAKNMTSQSGDRDLGMALFQVKDLADDYLRSGLSGETAKLFDAARTQYRNLMMLTSRTGVVNPATGDVSKAALPNVLSSKDLNGYVFGNNQSDFYNAARVGHAFKPIVGDSGTATRSMQNISLENLAKLPFGMVMRLYASKPVTNFAGATGQVLQNGMAPQIGVIMNDPLQKGLPLLGGQLGASLNQRQFLVIKRRDGALEDLKTCLALLLLM